MKPNTVFVSGKLTLHVILDLFAIGFIYLIPAISHLLNLPVYLIEPMRLMLILAMVHTHKNNAYLLAVTLPLFSYLVSGHPFILKTLLITAELILNVWLFFFLANKLRSKFFAMITAITVSKGLYYLLKAGLISFALIPGELFATPILIQLIMTLIFSGYVYSFARNKT